MMKQILTVLLTVCLCFAFTTDLHAQKKKKKNNKKTTKKTAAKPPPGVKIGKVSGFMLTGKIQKEVGGEYTFYPDQNQKKMKSIWPGSLAKSKIIATLKKAKKAGTVESAAPDDILDKNIKFTFNGTIDFKGKDVFKITITAINKIEAVK